MHQHYDAAYRLQSSGNFARADLEHTYFLVAALDRIANFYANTGDYAHAAPSYDEALALAPANLDLLMDYAGASLDAHNSKKTRSLLRAAMDLDGKNATDVQKAEIHQILGSTLIAEDNAKAAMAEFQTAVQFDPNIENMCALGNAVLGAEGHDVAAALFAKVITRFGDTAAVHMRIGRVYAMAGFPDWAIGEFKKAVALDYKMPDVHYSLGAAYMSSTTRAFPQAEAEYRKELALHPNDKYSYTQLGYIALTRHKYREAEIDFKRGEALSPLDVGNYMNLGKLYAETDRPAEEEAALRKAIELTADPSISNYAIERAHYRLGRLLMIRGNKAEGVRELHISEELLTERDAQLEYKLKGEPFERKPLEKTKMPTPEQADELKAFAKQISPMIAASYNNLGVHAAMAEEFAKASGYFQLAAKWNPALPGVDSNWGRAAFAAHDCLQAIGPLQRSLEAHPSDSEVRGMLGQCHISR